MRKEGGVGSKVRICTHCHLNMISFPIKIDWLVFKHYAKNCAVRQCVTFEGAVLPGADVPDSRVQL